MIASRVLHNEVLGGSCGGVAILRCEEGSIKDSNISSNSALLGAGSSTNAIADGGGMCVELSNQVLIERTTFETNQAENRGGGLALLQASNITVRLSTFLSNQATDGGSISIGDSLFVNVSDVVLSNSSATKNGGGLVVEASNDVLIQRSRFFGSKTTTGFGSSIWY